MSHINPSAKLTELGVSAETLQELNDLNDVADLEFIDTAVEACEQSYEKGRKDEETLESQKIVSWGYGRRR